MIKRAMSLFAFFMTVFFSVTGQDKINHTLVHQIDSLTVEDQSPAKMQDGHRADSFQAIVHRHYPVIKSIFEQYGFPGYNIVGKQGAHNYWLLVQHSDFTPDFQKKVLVAMKKEVDKGNASGSDYAYLVDRVNINAGKEQLYGTQVNMSFRGTTLKPCLDTLNLDKRRKGVGLMPIKEYLQQCDEAFYELNKGHYNKIKASEDSAAKRLQP